MMGTFFITTVLGGTFACLPAYEADLFGRKYLGVNHGRMLLSIVGSAFFGPTLLLTLRNSSEK